jgi:two-component system cell cycle sensor histidine kinase PleC
MQVTDALANIVPLSELPIAKPESIIDAFDKLRVAVAIFDRDDRLTYCNTHFRYVFQSFKTLDRLVGKTYKDLLRCKLENNEIAGTQVVEDPEAWIAHRMNLRRRPMESPFDERLTDGRWIRISERAIDGGGTIRMYTDITASKVNEYRFLSAVEDARDALAFWDQRDQLIMRNDAFEELFFTPGENLLPGVTFQEVLRVAADYHFHTGDEEAPDWVENRLDRHRMPAHREMWRHRDGRWFLVDEHRARDGSIVTRLSDVTEVKENELAMIERGTTLSGAVHQLEMSKTMFEKQSAEHVRALEELAVAKAELEAANTSRSRFLRIISHELRTPMNAIIGFSEIIKNQMLGTIGQPKYAEYAGDIYASGQHLLSLINDLLDMSKVEAGKWQLNRSEVNIEALVRSCTRLMSEQAASADIDLELSFENTHGTVYIDERAIRQVLLNLLSNALKFTGRTGIVRICTVIDIDDRCLTISVTDNGVGIQRRDLSRVFRPFEQGENNLNRSHEGTGLGLSLCKSLVELHGGSIALESHEGQGTKVTFELPLNFIATENPATDSLVDTA